MQPILPLILMALVLSGCGSLSGLNPATWFGGTDNAEPPAELVPLDNKIDIKKLWSSTIGSGTGGYRVKLVPAVTEDRVYAAASNGTVEAFDLFSGKSVWRVDVDIDISGATGAGDGLVLVGSANGLLVGLRQETGEEVWRNTLSSEVLSVPKSYIGVAVVHTVDGKLFGFDALTGDSLWVYDRTVPVLSLHGNSSPVISGISAIVGLANGKLASVGLVNGDLRWEVSITAPSGRSELERMVDIDVDPLVVEGVIYACTYQGEMAAVTEDTGVVLWRRKLSSYSGIGGNWRQVYVSDDEGNLWAIDPSNGSAIWKNDTLLRRGLSGPALLGEYVVVGDFEGYLHWFDSSNGEMLARTRAGSDAITTQPIARDGVLYVYGEGGALTALTIEVPGELSDEPPEEPSDRSLRWGGGEFSEDR